MSATVPTKPDRVLWRAFFMRVAVGLWVFEVTCQIVYWITE